MKKYKLLIAYDGTNYCGWQIQKSGTSIQGLIQSALGMILREQVHVTGAGRTDAGVHALEQAAHFSCKEEPDEKKLALSLNGILPQDIRIKKVEAVDASFHARYSAIGKTYHYHLTLGDVQDPFSRSYSYHVRHIDLPLLQEASLRFIGTYDFRSFANECDRGSALNKPIKTIQRLDVIQTDVGIRLEYEGDGFLYKMVRNITGTLLDIARHKISMKDLDAIFDAKDRSKGGNAAPAHALFLVKVHYPYLETDSCSR